MLKLMIGTIIGTIVYFAFMVVVIVKTAPARINEEQKNNKSQKFEEVKSNDLEKDVKPEMTETKSKKTDFVNHKEKPAKKEEKKQMEEQKEITLKK